jgi:hypothetical protein
MSDDLNIKKEMIREILHEDLGKRKICAKFIPHSRNKGVSLHADSSRQSQFSSLYFSFLK